MDEDFNSLNPNVTPKVPPKEKLLEPKEAKPTAKPVSTGPIFHSRITKVLFIILGTILAGLIGYTATNYYLSRQVSKNTVSTLKTMDTTGGHATADQPAADKATTQNASDTPTTPTTSTGPTTPTTSTGPTTPTTSTAPTTKVYCGVNGMPEGVCTAITSIEKDGLRGNQYVTQDTSQVPEGSTVSVDESSWKSGSDTTGTVSFAAVIGGKNYKGLGTFQVVSGIWKVTSYTLQ